MVLFCYIYQSHSKHCCAIANSGEIHLHIYKFQRRLLAAFPIDACKRKLTIKKSSRDAAVKLRATTGWRAGEIR
jgi:hypothetical protein